MWMDLELSLLIKLGSIAVHADEYFSPQGVPHDRIALVSVLKDPEVVAWIEEFTKKGFLPVKR